MACFRRRRACLSLAPWGRPGPRPGPDTRRVWVKTLPKAEPGRVNAS
ncbi:MAG: hypothetical protein ACE5R6_14175 [Candidatus Heimdallarchaeota archaeon]